ncbi:MAG: DUF4345 domain-containing protein [Salinisphaeraceae bacterium]
MKAFKTVVLLLAALAIVTGAADMLLGVPGQAALGVQLSAEAANDAVLNSQFRFLAAIWLGLGLLLCLCVFRLERYGPVLDGVLAVVFLGGVGRILALVDQGFPDTVFSIGFVVLAIAVEIVGMPALIGWHRKVRRARGGAATP